jgi:hypothetical protein
MTTTLLPVPVGTAVESWLREATAVRPRTADHVESARLRSHRRDSSESGLASSPGCLRPGSGRSCSGLGVTSRRWCEIMRYRTGRRSSASLRDSRNAHRPALHHGRAPWGPSLRCTAHGRMPGGRVIERVESGAMTESHSSSLTASSSSIVPATSAAWAAPSPVAAVAPVPSSRAIR